MRLMDYGLALPSLGDGATSEGIGAAAEAARRHGFRDVWTTDHLLVPPAAAADYGRIYEAITTLAWLAGQTTGIGLGTSVVVVPMRNAVVLAKELATVDVLSGGRLIAGFGIGWNEVEYGNVGVLDRFHVRGAYLEETIEVCRQLWSGSGAPFHGRFHDFDEYVFGPLPERGANLPIWLGGRDERALRRAGRLADAYQSSATGPAQYAERVPLIRAAAEAAGRPMPALSARVRVEPAGAPGQGYAMRGSPAEIAAEIRAFAELGVGHLALAFPESDPAGISSAVERFREQVAPLV
jgi:probable F420-dependent oxidoreductase